MASAPGKIILFGEHAVVYGRPAIAVPVFQVRAETMIEPRDDGRVEIDAVDVARRYDLRDASADDPIATIIRLTCARLGVAPANFTVHIHSMIPVASGLGSGAAVSVATARALGKFFQPTVIASRPERSEGTAKQSPTSSDGYAASSHTALLAMTNEQLSIEDISALAYEVEKLHHGTPSGIDNTVIAFEQPVYFIKGKPIESFRVARPFTLAIADTGIAAPTKIAVGDVRRAWEKDRARYEALFDQIGEIARKARVMIERGEIEPLGQLMNVNQLALARMGVSSIEIQVLVDAALRAGARGAKLSGGGRGGNVICLVDEVTQDKVERALMNAGAKRVMVTRIGDPKGF